MRRRLQPQLLVGHLAIGSGEVKVGGNSSNLAVGTAVAATTAGNSGGACGQCGVGFGHRAPTRPARTPVLSRDYRRTVPRRRPHDLRSRPLPVPALSPRPELPRQGHPLAEALALTDHCVERYRRRALLQPETELSAARAELRALVAKRGVPTYKPPSWFAGGRGVTAFYVVVDGRWVLPAQPAPLHAGALPARPYVVTTFISRDISEDELRELSGEELADLIAVPTRLAKAWARVREEGDRPAVEGLREAIAKYGQAQRTPPVWLRGRRPPEDRFFVMVGDDTALVVQRAKRGETLGPRFRATALVRDDELRGLTGPALVAAVQFEPRALREYRERCLGVPDDARAHLAARIAADGRIAAELPPWTGVRVTWHGPVLLLSDEALLLLRALPESDGAARSWRAVRYIAR